MGKFYTQSALLYVGADESGQGGRTVRVPMGDPVLTNIAPFPIPEPWFAYRDPEGLTGWGATEKEAVQDLLDQERA